MLSVLQKRAVRLICGAHKLEHSAPYYHKLNVFNLKQLYIYSIQLFMYKYVNEILPDIFQTMFAYNHNIHLYHTRIEDCFHVPVCSLSNTASFVRYTGVRIFNCLKHKVDIFCTTESYKRHLKLFIKTNDVLSLL